jgi:hypothetical protein
MYFAISFSVPPHSTYHDPHEYLKTYHHHTVAHDFPGTPPIDGLLDVQLIPNKVTVVYVQVLIYAVDEILSYVDPLGKP